MRSGEKQPTLKERIGGLVDKLAIGTIVVVAAAYANKALREEGPEIAKQEPVAAAPKIPGPRIETLPQEPAKKEQKESGEVNTALSEMYKFFTNPDLKGKRPAIFKAETSWQERCKRTDNIMKHEVGNLATLGFFLYEHIKKISDEDQKLREGLENEMDKALQMKSAPFAALRPEERRKMRPLIERKISDKEWWIAGCSGFVAKKIFQGREEKFEGQYSETFARLIALVMKGQKEKWGDAPEAAQALEAILRESLKKEP